MSPVIAFDIAVVAQKSESPMLHNGQHAKSEKVGGGGSVVGRDGY